MKFMITILLFTSVVCIAFSQTSDYSSLIQKKWDGGEAFAGEYDEKRFELVFEDGKFDMHYGPNHFPQYFAYQVNSDTLIIKRNDGFGSDSTNNPKFNIEELGNKKLVLRATNWAAVYITSVLSTPYVNASEKEFLDNQDPDLTNGGVLNVYLHLRILE